MKPKRMQHSFIKNRKEWKERSVLYKERKRMQKTFHSFIKNKKERKDAVFFYEERKRMQECCFLLKRTDAQPCILVASNTVEEHFIHLEDVLKRLQ